MSNDVKSRMKGFITEGLPSLWTEKRKGLLLVRSSAGAPARWEASANWGTHGTSLRRSSSPRWGSGAPMERSIRQGLSVDLESRYQGVL